MLFSIDSLLENLGRDSLAFLPELLVSGSIVLLLFLRLFSVLDRLHLGYLALVLTVATLLVGYAQWDGRYGLPSPEQEAQIRLDQAKAELASARESQTDPTRIQAAEATVRQAEGRIGQGVLLFNGFLVYDRLTLFLRLFLLGFTALIVWLSLLTGIPDREDSGDFYCLLLGAMLGMMLMASANHLLMIYLAVEMASLPSYALAGFLKGRRQSSEAALKYVVYGGGASGVMLYGISLLAGKFGTAYLPDMAVGYVNAIYLPNQGLLFDPILILGTLFILIGVAFKLAAVPFHFWCPDVFEGAAAEVAGFLSVASKGAAVALLARIVLTLSGLDPLVRQTASGTDPARFLDVVHYLLPALAFFAALTATFGNLAAYLQTNVKRLLAYSTIAHAGYMMMGLAPLTRDGLSAVLFYLIAYLFMNLGAFAIVAFIRNQTGSEDLSAYRGLARRSPWMVVTLSIFLLSLLGIPPLVGFAAKFQIFAALYKGGEYYTLQGEPGLGITLYVLLGIGAINTVLSAVYYIKVMKVMTIERRVEDLEADHLREQLAHGVHLVGGENGVPAVPEPVPLREPAPVVFYATVMSLVILGLGIVVDPLLEASSRGAQRFAAQPVIPRERQAAQLAGPQPLAHVSQAKETGR